MVVKVENDQTSKLKRIEKVYPLYLILYNYYNETALKWSTDNWKEVAKLLEEHRVESNSSYLEESIGLLKKLDHHDKEELTFDFNRLFIGPNKLLAPPYESSYRSDERTLMQGETLNVRRFYRKIGLQVKEKNSIPDDHITFELELICYLLSMAMEKEDMSYFDLYEEFFENHLATWAEEHSQDILNHSTYFICTAMAYVLQSVVKMEETVIQTRKGE